MEKIPRGFRKTLYYGPYIAKVCELCKISDAQMVGFAVLTCIHIHKHAQIHAIYGARELCEVSDAKVVECAVATHTHTHIYSLTYIHIGGV